MPEDAWVQRRYRPGGEQHEQCSDFVQLVDFNALAFTAQRFNHHTVEAFTCAEVVAQKDLVMAIIAMIGAIHAISGA